MPTGIYLRPSTNSLFHKKYKKDINGCWIWIASKIHTGYGMFWSGDKNITAHRYSYGIYNGEIPKGIFVCHTCDVRECVNPKHLFLGTHKDNLQDMIRKGRARFANKHRIVRGEENGQSKLSENNIRDIFKLHKRGTSQNELSKIFGCHQTNIHYILSGKTWRHVA